MDDKSIRIEHIKVRDLLKFSESVISRSSEGDFIPISMQRATAHYHNPYANPDDVALLVAFDHEDDIVGYFGILPIAFCYQRELHSAHWFSTWLVSPKVRGLGVGTMLMEEALSLKKDFLIVGSIHARRVCRKFGFLEREPLTYYWLTMSGLDNLNPVVWLLRLRRKITKSLGISDNKLSIRSGFSNSLGRGISKLAKPFAYWSIDRELKNSSERMEIVEIDYIRSDSGDNPCGSYSSFIYRGPRVINWMMEYPWVLNKGESITEKMDYYFSDTREEFKYITLEITELNEAVGYVVLSMSKEKSRVKVKLIDHSDLGPVHLLSGAIHVGRKYSADIIELPSYAVSSIRNKFLRWAYLQSRERIYQCMASSDNSSLAKAWHTMEFHLADGDMPFS